MKNIKFRGLTSLDVMVYGTGVLKDEYNTWLVSNPTLEPLYNGEKRKIVKEETIGQYTGLKDCNGVEIYEGDIIENVDFEMKCVVGFKNGAFTKSWENSNIHLLYDSNIEDGKLTDWVVIGNIYETKYLLEEN